MFWRLFSTESAFFLESGGNPSTLAAVKSRVLNVECRDRVGLVHAITGVLLSESLNIIGNQEFVDSPSRRFFMRTEIEGDPDEGRIAQLVQAAIGPEALVRFASLRPKRAMILVSKEHHCIGDLLIRHMFGELNCVILGVVSNHDVLRPLAQNFGIQFHHVPIDGRCREYHEREILAILDAYKIDFLVLAKYMRILSPEFVHKFERRIINIHHSFLPAFVGARPYQQAYNRGVKVIGATAHFVTEDLDQGPIIVQQVIPVDHSHSQNELAASGRDVEQIVLARALKLVFEDRVFVCGNRTIIFD